jgi:hypothetical protein
MRRKNVVRVFLFLVLSPLFSFSPLWAAGVGFYLGYSYNAADLEGSPKYLPSEGTTLVADALTFGIDDLHHGQVGFAIDSAPLRDKFFNYRGNIGLDVATAKLKRGLLGEESLTFYGLGHKSTFGFGIVRTDTMRLWLGPCLRFFFLFTGDHPYDPDYWDDDYDDYSIGYLFGGGGGLELGVNIRLTQGLCLSISAGYNALYQTISESDALDDLEGLGHMGFVQLTPLWLSGADKAM